MGGFAPHASRAERTIVELHRVLKSGAGSALRSLTGSLPDAARKLWYRLDLLFMSNEASLTSR
jgi:hypothetical protein